MKPSTVAISLVALLMTVAGALGWPLAIVMSALLAVAVRDARQALA